MNRLEGNYIVGAYLRLSKEDDRSDESSSIESQKLIIESFAKFNNLKINNYYSDDGFTGSNFNRPGFEMLKKDIEEGVINCVIVKDLSRLGRELYETGTYIEEYFLSKRVRFIAINDGYDSNIGDSMLGIRLSVNDLYLRDTSKKIRTSFDAKRKRGDYIGSFAVLGYQKDPNNTKRLIVDEVASEYVKTIFAYALEGLGTSRIASKLTDANIPIPSIYKKENRQFRSGILVKETGVWRSQTVKSILENEMYLGHMIQGRWKKISYNSKKLIEMPRSEWMIVKNTHEPIIDEVTFEKAKVVLRKNKRYKSKNLNKHLLQGLLFCKECGHRLTITQKSHTASKYAQCNNYHSYGRYGVCSNHRINYSDLEEDILHFLHEVGNSLSKKFDTKLSFEQVMKLQMSEQQEVTKKIAKYEQDNQKIVKVLENLYEDRLNDIISARQYSVFAKKYDDELAIIEEKVKELNTRLETLKDDQNYASHDQVKRTIEQFVSLKEVNRKLMLDLIQKIEIDEERNIEVFFNVDLSVLKS